MSSDLALLDTLASRVRDHRFQDRMRRAHVLVLGGGQLSSSTARQLRVLGIGGVTAEVTGSARLPELLDRAAPEVVMSGVVGPPDWDHSVDARCVTRGLPYVHAGLRASRGVVWSVNPGVSACRACLPAGGTDRAARWLRTATGTPPVGNGRNGQAARVAELLGALCAFEVLRYVTGWEPAYAGEPVLVEVTDALVSRRGERWRRHPACPQCRPAGALFRSVAGVGHTGVLRRQEGNPNLSGDV